LSVALQGLIFPACKPAFSLPSHPTTIRTFGLSTHFFYQQEISDIRIAVMVFGFVVVV
jgi:hypothetical protein